jgi:hypothetical protein
MIVYDCEIEKGILGKKDVRVEGIEYCGGWRDFQGMGISVIGVYDFSTDRTRIFMKDNLDEFQKLIDETDIVVGYNSMSFDNQLVAAHGVSVPLSKNYDILVEIWKGLGLGPVFQFPTHAGYSLDAVAQSTLGLNKTGHGALAPIHWQQGKLGSVIDYCLNDVFVTVTLLEHIIQNNFVKNPKKLGSIIPVSPPSIPE